MARPLFSEKILDAVSAQNAAAVLPVGIVDKADYTNFYVVFGAATSAGTVVIECSHDKDYTGTWANLATLAWAAATSVKNAAIAGNHKAIRARLSVAAVGGTIDVYAIVNG